MDIKLSASGKADVTLNMSNGAAIGNLDQSCWHIYECSDVIRSRSIISVTVLNTKMAHTIPRGRQGPPVPCVVNTMTADVLATLGTCSHGIGLEYHIFLLQHQKGQQISGNIRSTYFTLKMFSFNKNVTHKVSLHELHQLINFRKDV